MIFLFNLIFSILYCDCINRCHKELSTYNKLSLFMPLLIVWTLLCGSQYYVGSDYSSYIDIFNGTRLDFFEGGGEYGFVYFIKIINYIGFKGQSIYFIIYTLSFLLLFGIIKSIDIKYWGIYILLYIVESSLFNNQLNIVRQSFSIYIGTYAVMLINSHKKTKGLLLILIASTFHMSAIIFLIFLIPFKFLHQLWPKTIYIGIILLSLLAGLLLSSTSIFSNILDYLPANYAWYLQSGRVEEISFVNKITKYIYIPLFIISIYFSPNYNLNRKEIWLYNWGLIGYAIRLLILNLQIVNRLSFIFILISLFPLLYLFRYLIKHDHSILIYTIYASFILFYSIKVVLYPSNEYAYDSIFFHLIS